MVQITWRNVGGIGSSGPAKRDTSNGVATILGAFDPLEQELNRRAAINEQNWNAQADQNTRAVKAQLQQIRSLADLNRMQDEGQITEDAFNKQFGAQYDASAVNPAIDARRQALQRAALDNLNGDALAAADQERDLSAGAQRLRELIQQNGGRGDFVERAATDFMNNNKDRLSQYAKANKNEVEDQLSNTPAPTTPQQVAEYIAQARKAGVKDLDAYRSRLTSELNDYYMHEKYGLEKARFGLESARAGREAFLFNQGQSDRRALNNAYTAATKLMKEQGLNSKEAFNQVSSLVPGEYQSKVLHNITQQEIDMSSMTPQQKELMGRTIARGQQQIAEYQAAVDAKEASFIKQRNTVTGITPSVLKVVDDAIKNEGIVGKIVSGISDTWWDGSTRIDTDKDDIEQALNTYKDQITRKLPNATPQETDAILWLAYQDSNKIADSLTGSHKGLDTTSMEATLKKRMEAFLKGEAIEQDRIAFKAAANKDITNFNQNLGDFTTATKQSIETLNKTSKAGDVVGFLNKVADGRLNISKNEKGQFTTGALDQLRKQRQKAADDKAAKEAAEKLEKIRKKYARRSSEYPSVEPEATVKNNNTDALKNRILQEMGNTSYTQPAPEVTPITFKKRPQ